MRTDFMKKIRPLLMIIAAFLCLSGAVHAQVTVFDNREQLEYYLKSQRPDSIQFSCSKSLYKELEKDDFRELFRLMVRAGIDHNTADVSYTSTCSQGSTATAAATATPQAAGSTWIYPKRQLILPQASRIISKRHSFC